MFFVWLAEPAAFVTLRVTRAFCGFFAAGFDDFSGCTITGAAFAGVGVSVVSFTLGEGWARGFETCLTGAVLDWAMLAGTALPGSTDSPDAATCVVSTGSADMSAAVVVFNGCGTGPFAVFVSAAGDFSPVGSADSTLPGLVFQ